MSPGGRHLLRRGLLVAEIALALVLLTGAGLLARSFGRLQSTPLGFDSTGVLTAAINLPASRYATPAARSAFRRDMLARVRALPSVEGATMALGVPPSLGVLFGDARVDGRALPASQQPGEMAGVYVGDGYFDLLRIRVLEGRTFGPLDANGDDVVIVNASAARRFWPGRSAVGGRFGVGAGDATVIGVVDDVKANGLAESPGGVQIYYPFDKDSFAGGTLIVRTAGDPMAIVAALKAAVWAGDNRLALRNVSPATDLIATSLAPQRFNLVLLAIFAGLGVVLAVVGVYGVMMYFAAQREHEMGVRLALGATRRDVMRLVLRQSAVVTLAGLAIGIGASWALSRFLTSLLFEVAPTDPATFTATAAVLALAAFAGTSIPAWRVAKVDPVKALRAD